MFGRSSLPFLPSRKEKRFVEQNNARGDENAAGSDSGKYYFFGKFGKEIKEKMERAEPMAMKYSRVIHALSRVNLHRLTIAQNIAR